MVNKLNFDIKEMHNLTKDIKSNIISIQKGKMPFFSKLTKRFSEFLKKHNLDVKYLLLAIPIIAIFLIVREAQHLQDLRSRASVHTANVAFQLQNWGLPPEGNFDIWVNADSPVSFVNIIILFDPTLVKLTHEITTTGLTRIVKVTSMDEANSTGIVSIVLGLDPSMATNPPNGTFQIASLALNANTTDPNVATSVSFNTSQMQLIATDQSVFQLAVTNLSLILNPIPTPTPVPTPTHTPVPSPTPTPNDVIPPTVTITTPPDISVVPSKGNLAIRATASDTSGVSKIVITLDGVIKKTCSNNTSCQANIPVKNIPAGSHTIAVTATDKSANLNTTTSTISVTK